MDRLDRIEDGTLSSVIMRQDEQTRGRLQGVLREIETVEGRVVALERHNVVLTSNIPMKMGRNTYAICVGDGREIKRFTMAQEMQGWPIFSDRSELGGVLACIDLVEVIAEWRGINPRVKVYCDNQAAINFVKDPYIGETPTWADRRNIDLKMQIRSRLTKARTTVNAHPIKSHQNNDRLEEKLPKEVQMNCICDRISK